MRHGITNIVILMNCLLSSYYVSQWAYRWVVLIQMCSWQRAVHQYAWLQCCPQNQLLIFAQDWLYKTFVSNCTSGTSHHQEPADNNWGWIRTLSIYVIKNIICFIIQSLRFHLLALFMFNFVSFFFLSLHDCYNWMLCLHHFVHFSPDASMMSGISFFPFLLNDALRLPSETGKPFLSNEWWLSTNEVETKAIHTSWFSMEWL